MYRAPTDCVQFLTGQSGFLTSYNWQNKGQIVGHDFTFCIRREEGYCTIQYNQAQGTTIGKVKNKYLRSRASILDFTSKNFAFGITCKCPWLT